MKPSGLELRADERWYVAATLPRKEAYALEHLASQGFRGFVPRQRVTKRHARRFRTELVPVFPGYAFLILDPQRMSWRSVNGTRGIKRLLTENERPLPVRRGVVETLVGSVDQCGLLRFDRGLVAGQKVRLIAGPFAERLGVVEGLDANGRIRLLFELMGQAAQVVVPSDQVQAV